MGGEGEQEYCQSNQACESELSGKDCPGNVNHTLLPLFSLLLRLDDGTLVMDADTGTASDRSEEVPG